MNFPVSRPTFITIVTNGAALTALTQHQQREAFTRRERGEPMREIARSYNVHHSTISRSSA
jgi:IS30 family transposase